VKKSEIHQAVRKGYAAVARSERSCCGPQSSCGCGGTLSPEALSKAIGYNDREMQAVPEGANLGLGCGNPVALASLKKGQTVVDLGSGAGFDCFLTAKRVGPKGKVIGVDMTPEMIEKARENARKGKYRNVEFRLGEIEHLPVADNSADAVISNCVINLVPDKQQVFRDAFRVLKPGGRLMISDIVLLKPLLPLIRKSVSAYVGCLSGAVSKTAYLKALHSVGFRNVAVLGQTSFPVELMVNDPTGQAIVKSLRLKKEKLLDLARSVVSVSVSAKKPR